MQPSDNDLDKMSKDAAEHFEPSGASPNWTEMELLLDKHLPQKKEPRRRILIVLFILLFLLSAGGYLYYADTNKDNSVATKKIDNTIPGDENKTAPPSTDKNNSATAPVEDNIGSSTDEQKSSSNTSPLIAAPVQKDNKNIHTFPGEKDAAGIRSSKIQVGKTAKAKVNASQGGVTEDDLAEKQGESPIKTDVTITPSQANGTDKQTNTDNEINPSQKTSVVVEPSRHQISPASKVEANSSTVTAQKTKTTATNKGRWEISLLYSPELTTIKWTHVDKPGSNYGLLIGYGLTKKFSIQTGLVKSRKNYTANEPDFKFNYTPGSTYKFSDVSGYCNMYEIPLNLKYHISLGKKLNVFALGGISSYFMKKEFYTYHYHNSMYDWSAEYYSQKNYWLSVATLGVGVEKVLSKNVKIGISPYLKIPFKGMGAGELKLQGAGINFLLSYKPAFSKKVK